MKVALVHDYLKEFGGAERVLEVLHRLWPEAPVFTAFFDRQALGPAAERFADWDIRTSFAQRLPAIGRRHHTLRFLIPYFWESLDLSGFDLVISSSSGYLSKSVLTRPETLHICYCHTPPRYLWGYAQPAAASWYRRAYELWVNTGLRQYDFAASQRVDRFVANSHAVARRIAKFYGKSAQVIPPPVRVHGGGRAGDEYYLYVGRLSRPKQVDLAIRACEQLNRPLWIVGSGQEEARLRALAGPGVRFLGNLPDERMAEIYAGAKALLFPCAHEDFGIVPVEAMGHGVPVIALDQGGVRESVVEGRTGLFFAEASPASLCAAIERFEAHHFSARACIERAGQFSEAVFSRRFEQLVESEFNVSRLPASPLPL
ncbi:glycosyltransferase [Gloeobacter kilaueensis]|uniref:Glycosyl transferase group 1 n=1 Tax=Gloeobacter kilaueensis (strain ATCC BAA-2537 / CCAP 1431/1 / ULC 316 / JS1) TaxID=1183438 RepID=U5QCV0_GLOK1|nr:glycosyltransferase [Gloeobacter kilaueensis]AGY56706.1 glycosyl transferase group 1 [Gloeobacter kilaueensis JS1]